MQNKSLLITAALAAIAYLLYRRLDPQDKREVNDFVEKKTKQAIDDTGTPLSSVIE